MFRTEVDNKSLLSDMVAAGSDDFKYIYNKEMENFDQAYKNLEGIHGQLAKKRDEMKVLRDGYVSKYYTLVILARLKSHYCTAGQIAGIFRRGYDL